MAGAAPTTWRTWELPRKLRLYARLRHELWLRTAHEGQITPPELLDEEEVARVGRFGGEK